MVWLEHSMHLHTPFASTWDIGEFLKRQHSSSLQCTWKKLINSPHKKTCSNRCSISWLSMYRSSQHVKPSKMVRIGTIIRDLHRQKAYITRRKERSPQLRKPRRCPTYRRKICTLIAHFLSWKGFKIQNPFSN